MKRATITKVKHPRYSHRVRYTGPAGKTLQAWFTNETEALKFAKKRDKETGITGTAFGMLAPEEKAAVEFWRTVMEQTKDAPPPPLAEILKEYASRWKATRSSVTVQTAVETYEAIKTAEGLRPMSIQGIRTRCGRFAKDFATRPICSITTAEISDWILGLAATPRTKKPHAKQAAAPAQIGNLAKRNHRLALSGLFNFAKTRGWVTENPVKEAARPKPTPTSPGILSPEKTARLFDALELHAPELVAFWAVRFFAGVREQEALRMEWGMIDLGAKKIHLPKGVTKTGRARTVKITPALAAFLGPKVKPEGLIAPSTAMARRWALAKALKAIRATDEAFTMPSNCARHSFATFHFLAFRNSGETSIQLGHGGSPELLHKHYEGVATEAQAKAFWAIRPTEAKNVVQIKARKRA
jgi:integrase